MSAMCMEHVRERITLLLFAFYFRLILSGYLSARLRYHLQQTVILLCLNSVKKKLQAFSESPLQVYDVD